MGCSQEVVSKTRVVVLVLPDTRLAGRQMGQLLKRLVFDNVELPHDRRLTLQV